MSLSSKRTVVDAGLYDNEEMNNKKQKNGCGQEVKKRVQVASESEREARLEAARKQREAHWLELEATRMAEEEYEEDHVVEEEYDQEDDEDNEIENYDYDDLHLAYLGDKSPKLKVVVSHL
ncbi:hypothetical protein Tco_0569952 [Tanacetum coccineum]